MVKKDLGIIVFGYIRLTCLSNTVKSLVLQNAENVHVWLDIPEEKENSILHTKSIKCINYINENYQQFEINVMREHLGIELMTLEGLQYMAEHYNKIIILEDDCFPTCRAVNIFNIDLDKIANNEEIFSIYGHHYLVPSEENGTPIGRFNGWGWATHSHKLEKILPSMRKLLIMPDKEYFLYVKQHLTRDIKRRLDVIPKRNAVEVIKKYKTWDSIMCLLTAMNDLLHKRTSVRVIFNCGGDPDESLHYKKTRETPPFNMIDKEDVWEYFYCEV